MKSVLFILLVIWSGATLAIPCDCEVRVHSPLTGTYKMPPVVIKNFELEEYSSYAAKNKTTCQNSCLEEFQKEMPSSRLSALLVTYSMQLIEQKVLGYNCTGLTTLKYPVRVRAKLGNKGLGNVADLIQVVNHEEVCF